MLSKDKKLTTGYKENSISGEKSGSYLDKLAQRGYSENDDSVFDGSLSSQDYDYSALLKRARAKYFSVNYVLALINNNLKSDLLKSYWNTYYCCRKIEIVEGKTRAKYCKNRWCMVCNRIATAKSIFKYKDTLLSLEDLHFLTLTIPNVNSDLLRTNIDKMNKTFENIRRTVLRKYGFKIKGIKKLEITYNSDRNDYHPHFHLLIENRTGCEAIILEWLKRYPSAKRISQDFRKVETENGFLEIFKYATKLTAKGKNNNFKAMDNIFIALKKLRTYQPIGIKAEAVNEAEKGEENLLDIDVEKVFTWIENDWIDKQTGECLTEYEPKEEFKKYVESFNNSN